MNLNVTQAMSQTTRLFALAALIFSAALTSFGQAGNPVATASEEKLIAILKSDAPQKEKADACLQLARIGTKSAVAALAALLPDEKLNHMARYGLETIPDPSVDAALRAALGTVKGRPLVGVIGSIGVRRDARAIDALAGFLQDPDPDVAQAAARALGKIGTPAAAKPLRAALAGVSTANQLAFCEGLLRCAEAMTTANRRDDAKEIYEQLRGLSAAPHQVRTAAVREAILIRGRQGTPLLQEYLASPDYLLFAAAVRTSMEMPGRDVTTVLVESLDKLPADNQVVVLQALALRGDATALPTLITASRTGAKPVRLAGIRGLAELGQPTAAPVLAGLLGDPDRELAQAAQESLAALKGPAVDEIVMAMLNAAEPEKRVTAIELITRRRMTSAVPALLKAAGDPDAKVRSTAARRAGELAGADDLPAFLQLLMQASAGPDLEAAEQAVGTVSAKAGSPDACVEKLASLMGQAAPAQKSALVRIISTLGGPGALKAVRAAVADANPDVHATAVRALGDWKSLEPAPDLLALAKAAANPAEKQLCLRSLLGLARNPDLPADQRLAICRDAAGLLQSKDEKRLLLSALGGMPSVEAVKLIAPYLDDADVKEEAGAATVSVAEKLLKGAQAAGVAGSLVGPLEKAGASSNADLAKQAQELLKQAQAKAASK